MSRTRYPAPTSTPWELNSCAGRFSTDADDASKPLVAIINQSLARKYFPSEDPIGKKYGDDGLTPASIKEIVGVVDDIKEGTLDSEIWPAEYIPFNQSPTPILPWSCAPRRPSRPAAHARCGHPSDRS